MASAVGQGAVTGAAAGAAAGSVVGPWGTVIGAGVGAVAGAVEGYGVQKRQKAQQAAEAQYQQHLRTYLAQSAAASQELGKADFNVGQTQLAQIGQLGGAYGKLPNMVQQGAQATNAAYGAIPGGAPVPKMQRGWDTGAQGKDVAREKQASDAFLAPQTQAYEFKGGQIQAGLGIQQAQNQYAIQGAQSGQDLRQLQQMYALQQGDRDLAFQRQYGNDSVAAYHAANAGSEQMLYGQLLQTGAQMGAGLYGQSLNRQPQQPINYQYQS